MKSTLKYILPAFLVLAIFVSCAKEYQEITVVDQQNIDAYIKQNGLSLQRDALTGVYYKVIKAGTGPDIDFTKQTPIIFTAKSLDGKYSKQDTFASTNRFGDYFGYFTSEYGAPPLALRNAVKNFLKKEGGEINIILPSSLAYGKLGNEALGIDGNQSIEYTVKVLVANDLANYDQSLIQKYMQANNLTGFTKSADDVWYKISDMGTGSPITKDSSITAVYTGKLFNGVVFDQATADAPAKLGPLYRLRPEIPAWIKIIPLIKEGGSVRMIIPSKEGYGITGVRGTYTRSYGLPFTCTDFDMKITNVSP